MLRHYGFACWIECGGKQLPVYVEEAEGSVKTAWIASEVGKVSRRFHTLFSDC